MGSLQVLARNERGRGVPRSLGLRGSPVSWGLKGAERAERRTGWLCQNERKIWHEIVCEKIFCGVQNVARNSNNVGL